MTRSSSPPPAGDGDGIEVVAYPPAWRALAAALQVCSRGSLLFVLAWILGLLPALGEPPLNTLKQMRLFAVVFAAPEALAWCLRSAFAGRARVAGGALVVARRDVRIEVPLDAVDRLEAWTVPLPRPGASVMLRSGTRLEPGLQLADVSGLAEAMIAGGASPAIRAALDRPAAVFARARAAAGASRLDHPFLKFVVYSLVPAVPVYRLHQYITFGGPLGEYYTFGLKAYLLGFALWWLSFAMGLLMFAAAVRVVVEAGSLLAALLAPAWAPSARRMLEAAQRLVFYVGMPAWLALRLLA